MIIFIQENTFLRGIKNISIIHVPETKEDDSCIDLIRGFKN